MESYRHDTFLIWLADRFSDFFEQAAEPANRRSGIRDQPAGSLSLRHRKKYSCTAVFEYSRNSRTST
eukprot:COSAG01_NODE_65660_length_272_cov_1.335260_1_plen_66_part_10